MRGSDKKKLIAAGILLPLSLGSLYLSLTPSSTPAAATPSRRQSALQALTKSEPDGSRAQPGSAKKPRTLTTAALLDPVVRVDLLVKLQAVKYEGTERNIFQFYTAPPPAPIPVAAKDPVVGPQQPLPAVPSPKPAAPQIALKFYGLATAPGVLPKKAFLQDGEDIFIAAEGELVKKRYKVVRINDNNVEMEDTQYNSTQRIPLQES